MKIAILDNHVDTLRGLACFRELDGHDVTIRNWHKAGVFGTAEIWSVAGVATAMAATR
jgi:hypothetical protein